MPFTMNLFSYLAALAWALGPVLVYLLLSFVFWLIRKRRPIKRKTEHAIRAVIFALFVMPSLFMLLIDISCVASDGAGLGCVLFPFFLIFGSIWLVTSLALLIFSLTHMRREKPPKA
ncbi:hypothetical protein FWC63_01350 [Candidatus Saccharibacteria bacterium]|nr:hypothetical protein [Candidatus Saccharibacteria bacterium]